ncbi:hypothetical protein FE257_004538 [Aspergillus nanangensis]|uniref:Zn(2)-C6 fungal-type domain-containing protein n=1 Tax=Aspergillus nanangensis TaxID=2582783 RepID=A0AAD4CY81_ASPNN|nr:hypothetical protein FE257_004538 [Aspergillus nanangensis]
MMSTSKFAVEMPPRKHAPEEPAESQPRAKKRAQVARACDWCRVHRVKCDSDRPCSNCRSRGGDCSNQDGPKTATLPQAVREIQRLTERVKELERELEQEQERKAVHTLNTPSSALPSTPGERDTVDVALSTTTRSRMNVSLWEGIHISTARSPQKTWFGPSSLFYFIGRINTFLTSALKQSHSAQRMLPKSASTLLDGPTTLADEDQTTPLVGTDDPIRAGESLSATQEEYFLGLFWQSFYTTYPILDEQDFKDHYNSLWVESETERKPSALVDIAIAVCMQYGTARMPTPRQGAANSDATIAGRWHYRRCQTLLATELESPSISTLQCHMLSSIYLCCASFQNMADNACGLAVRTAYMLGLHLEPPATMPRREQELRKRLWWLVYVLESKMSMKLGRPFLLHAHFATCSYPSDDRDTAKQCGSSFAPLADSITWLTWPVHNIKLMVAARTAYTCLYQRIPEIYDLPTNNPNPHCTTSLLEDWLTSLPPLCKTPRQSPGTPFSTDLSPLEIEPFAPLWLQRERLLLELMYHNLSINLYRPAICFALARTPTPLADRTAMKCAAHAVAFTHIVHQVLTSTNILTGWHETFQWSWNAAMTLVGFLLAYPYPQSAASTQAAARTALDLAVTVFETYAQSFAVAASAAAIMRDLSGKVDLLGVQSWQSSGSAKAMGTDTDEPEVVVVEGRGDQGLGGLGFVDSDDQFAQQPVLSYEENEAQIEGILGQSIDIFADPYGDFDWSGMNGGLVDQWAFLPGIPRT